MSTIAQQVQEIIRSYEGSTYNSIGVERIGAHIRLVDHSRAHKGRFVRSKTVPMARIHEFVDGEDADLLAKLYAGYDRLVLDAQIVKTVAQAIGKYQQNGAW